MLGDGGIMLGDRGIMLGDGGIWVIGVSRQMQQFSIISWLKEDSFSSRYVLMNW